MWLALSAGEVDWIQFRDELPEAVMQGWEEFDLVEPIGSGRMYEFLSHAFVKLAYAFHSSEFAYKLDSKSFCWWQQDQHQTKRDLTETEMDAYFEAMSKHRK